MGYEDEGYIPSPQRRAHGRDNYTIEVVSDTQTTAHYACMPMCKTTDEQAEHTCSVHLPLTASTPDPTPEWNSEPSAGGLKQERGSGAALRGL